ncbi:MAG TPA: periplasmic heavy metal sensor [Rhizomicrobium sp.]
MSDTPPPPRRRRSWLLIVSLCLNIALVPVVAAVVLRALHRDTQVGSGGILAPRSVMAAIPDARVSIRKVVDAHSAKILRLRQASARARREAFDVLAAPDYTPGKFAAALNAVTAADTALETETVAMMGDSIAVLVPAQRAAMVEKIRKRNRSWRWRMFKPKAQ